MTKIIIIGGGPAGMMAAISAKTHHPTSKVTLIDKNAELGKKLKITGGGRCNVTAAVENETVIKSIPKNGKFIYSSLSNFNTTDIQNFFIENHCPLKVEDHNRVFPESNRSRSIIETLHNKIIALNIEILFEHTLTELDLENNELTVNNTSFNYDYLILATGGKTYPQTGSDGSLYQLLTENGHTITPLLPAEVPLVSNDSLIAEKLFQGLTFPDVALSILNEKNKKKQIIKHDLLFTHFGLSGPVALRASFYVQQILEKQQTCKLLIDFLPEITTHELSNQLLKQKKQIFEYLQSLSLPKRYINYVLEKSKNNIEILLQLLKAFPITIYQTRGFQQAFLTNGGISIKEINPKTMKSKFYPNVAFAGELIDINGYTGGFNITAALSTGYTAGKYIIE